MSMSKPVARRRLLAGSLAGSLGALAAALPGVPARAQGVEDNREPPLPRTGMRLALPEVTLFDGSTFRPEQAQGQVVVVYWWASWCPLCAVQSPLMDKLWRAQRGRGLRMLALSVDRRAEDATAYLAKRGLTFPAGWVTPAVAQVMPKPRGLPVTVVRGRDERVLQAEAGQMIADAIDDIATFL